MTWLLSHLIQRSKTNKPQILAGDPKQLGPSTRSPLVSQLGLAKSLQEHLMDTRPIYDVHGLLASPEGRCYIVKLVKNYRSHEAREWVNPPLAGGRLVWLVSKRQAGRETCGHIMYVLTSDT